MSDEDQPVPDWLKAPTLKTFLSRAPRLTQEQRRVIVDQAHAVLENFYVHLPLKRATRGVDPLRQLQALHRRLPRVTSDPSFHAELADIFARLNDFHTVYVLPKFYSGAVAFLPFTVEEHTERARPAFLVAHLAHGFTPPRGFGPGTEITAWNRIPIIRAVEAAARRSAGANPDAQWAQGLASLTLRPMVRMPPPEEETVTVSFLAPGGAEKELRCEWRVHRPGRHRAHPAPAHHGLNQEADMRRLMRKSMFAGPRRPPKRQTVDGPIRTAIESRLPDIFRAERLQFGQRELGYIRLRTFLAPSDTHLVDEFIRLAERLPPQGLILDLRDNPGGLILAAERLLQVLTPGPIEPERAQLIATPAVLDLCRTLKEMKPWRDSVAHALETGAPFSGALPLHTFAACNDIGQRYHGPVVLITNARCYSATDTFSAGFRDHAIGPIIGTDRNTGAGGATCWTHRTIARFLDDRTSPLRPLPRGVDFRVALKRTLRVGAHAGTEIEEVGIRPDILHHTTERDILHDNTDLLTRAARILAKRDWFQLDAQRTDTTLRLRTHNIDRIDAIHIRRRDTQFTGRPLFSESIPPAKTPLTATNVALPANATGPIRLNGYRRGSLVASRLVGV